jgi:hypothetical protein
MIALQEKVEVPTADGGGDELRFYANNWLEHRSFKSEEEFVEALKQNGYDDEKVGEAVHDLEHYEVKYEWVDRNWFFTNEGYEEHLRLNRHNYGEVRPYIKHLFRNPEMAAVVSFLQSQAPSVETPQPTPEEEAAFEAMMQEESKNRYFYKDDERLGVHKSFQDGVWMNKYTGDDWQFKCSVARMAYFDSACEALLEGGFTEYFKDKDEP